MHLICKHEIELISVFRLQKYTMQINVQFSHLISETEYDCCHMILMFAKRLGLDAFFMFFLIHCSPSEKWVVMVAKSRGRRRYFASVTFHFLWTNKIKILFKFEIFRTLFVNWDLIIFLIQTNENVRKGKWNKQTNKRIEVKPTAKVIC